VIYSRVNWACVYLVQAGLLERPKRGRFVITNRGRQVLRENPQAITREFLQQFDEFCAFLNRRSERSSAEASDQDSSSNPEETLELAHEKLRGELANELLSTVKACSPRFFETLVIDLLIAMGYGGSRVDAGQALGRTGDGGVDGIIKEDKLGLDFVYVQAKRWEGSVGRPVVQGFAGSLEGRRARKGVLITTSNFTKDAEEYVDRIEKRIVLIDGARLAELMIDHSLGVTQIASYPVHRIDSDYFEED
jgi:restriction system protein